jgi:WD40 repeat protein
MRCLATILCVFIWGAAHAQSSPFPQLDTGGHTASIRGIAFTPDGKRLVSAGEDKVIRVWDLQAGRTVRTIRGESSRNLGRIFALALSPNGKWLAVGGDFGSSAVTQPGASEKAQPIRLYDFNSGRLVALLHGHTAVIRALAFSADGSKLISGSSDHTAIIWDAAPKSGVQASKPKRLHRLEGHKADIFSVAFSPDGSRAVTGSYDKDLRLWRVSDGALIATMSGHGDKVMSLAVARNGTIASGDLSGAIRLWNGRDGRFLRILTQQKFASGSLSFSRNGKLLLSTCGFGNCSGAPGHVYDVASGGTITSYHGHDNAVLATAFSLDGRWVATGGGTNRSVQLWDPLTGRPRLGQNGRPLVLGGQGQVVFAASFSADGRQIGWATTDPCPDKAHCPNELGSLQWALTLPFSQAAVGAPVTLQEREASGFRRATTTFESWSLSHREGGNYGYDNAVLDILKNAGAVASLTRGSADGLGHHAYSFSPDGESIVSGGSSGVITAYDREGRTLGQFAGHEGNVFAVVPSHDGRYLVTCSADQTVRLWNLKTRELLVSLFQGKDGEWVIWTPQGYYVASGPGSDLIGWQINHGPEHEADYVTAAQLRKTFNRPDIVARTIQLASAEEAVKEAQGTNFKLADLLDKPVPRFRIASPAPDATVSGGSMKIDIVLEATPDPVKSVRIQVNGREIAEHQPKMAGRFAPGKLTFSVPLAAGRNTIRVVATNETGETTAELAVVHDGDGALDRRGTLYILSIGVDKYPNLGMRCGEPGAPKSCDLSVAGADAKAFAKTMAARLGPLHRNVVSRVLVNGGDEANIPSAANVLDVLGMLRQSEPNDTIVLFVSGHGINEGINYRFLPTDAEVLGDRLRPSTIVPWVNFQEAIEAAKGRRILFVDTCHSGNSYNQRLSNDSYAANIIVYAAARWDQVAWERDDLGHGLFTYAVVEGVNGAAKTSSGEVKTESLRDFLAKRVAEMAKQLKREQEPQYFRGRDAQDYVLVRYGS